MNQAVASALEGMAVALAFLLLHWWMAARVDRAIPKSIRNLPWQGSWSRKNPWIGPRRFAIWHMFWTNAMLCAGFAVVSILMVLEFDPRRPSGNLSLPIAFVGLAMVLIQAIFGSGQKRWAERRRLARNAERREVRRARKAEAATASLDS